jgi:hypothetical protein
VRQIVFTLLLVGLGPTGWAQTAAAPALKAAFLYNFAKFTAWPTEVLAAGAPLVVCSTDAAVFDQLARTTAGRSIGAHAIDVRQVSVDAAAIRACHVAYVSEVDATRAAQLADALKSAPVLTVGDSEEFVRLGGIAGLFVESGQMRFAISVERARRAGLELSSKLLNLARII